MQAGDTLACSFCGENVVRLAFFVERMLFVGERTCTDRVENLERVTEI